MTSPTGGYHRAPDPYVGFDGTDRSTAPRSADRRGAPVTDAPVSPSHAPPVATAPSPYLVPSGPPTTWSPSGAPARRAGAGAGCVVVVAVVVVLVAVVGVLARLVAGGGSSSGAGGSGGSDLEVRWSVEPRALADDWGYFESVDGAQPGLLPTAGGWVAMVDASTVDAVLGAIDPDDGSVRWSIELPESRCTHTGDDPAAPLTCLTRDDPGDPFQVVSIDPVTGDRVGDPLATTLTEVPVLLAPLADGLLALSAAGSLTALDADGTVLWHEPVGIADLDTSYLEADLGRYDDAVLLHLGWYRGTVHATVDGFTVRTCRALVVTAEAWVCESNDDDETAGYAPDGEMLWSGDWSDYYLVDQYNRITPVAIADNWDGSVSAVDPTTGEKGDPVQVGDGRDNLAFFGDAEHPLVATDDAVALLEPDLTGIRWQTAITDEYLNIANGGLVGDTIVVDGEHSYGLDVGTGDVRWERDFLGGDAAVVEDAWIVLQSHELRRFEV